MIAALTGCVESLSNRDFSVVCHIDEAVRPASVSLFTFQQEYAQVSKIGTATLDSATGAFVFEGQIERPMVAFLKFDNDTVPFYFVLEPGETLARIGAGSVTLSGGEMNHKYFDFLKQRNGITAARAQLREQYLNAVAADSTIDVEVERQFVAQDSILADSLDNITVDMINENTQVSRIVFDRFVNTLSQHSLSKVKLATRANN